MSGREFSKVSPAVWRSGKFAGLDSDGKVLQFYYLTCEHQNSTGSFRVPDGYACSDLGWALDRYLEARRALIDAGLIRFDQECSTVYVERWFKHNPPMNQSHADGTVRRIYGIESDPIRETVEADFSEADAMRLNKVRSINGAGQSATRLLNTRIMQPEGHR